MSDTGALNSALPHGLHFFHTSAATASRPVGINTTASPRPESSGMFLSRICFVWGFAIASCHVTLWWIGCRDALLEDLAVISNTKAKMGLSHLSDPDFANFMQDGKLSTEQQSMLFETRLQMVMRGRDLIPAGLMDMVDHCRDHWHFSLQNWSEGRYHTALSSVFCHRDLQHLAQGAIMVPYLLNLAFRCGFSPGAVVVLTVGSQLACSAGDAVYSRSSLPTATNSPGQDRRIPQSNIDGLIRARRSMGSSGVLFGVATALACLHPTAQMIGGIPLWPVMPLLLCTDMAGMLWQDQRRDTQRVVENGSRTGRGRSGDRSSAGHLAGAAFGLVFALVKFRLGSRL
ncbi:hypothetical protein PG991_016255 [Apiospora marii]|uniref:Peptidase S54 rhomboid domain-containing protein n=1 Tax=Apiospora marii TaxID=335849 RepID=A0ABR1QZP7_9PEZI